MRVNGGFRCICPRGYSGSRCEIRNACQSNPCMNGGTCQSINGNVGYQCVCPSGFSGLRCETSVFVCFKTSFFLLRIDLIIQNGTYLDIWSGRTLYLIMCMLSNSVAYRERMGFLWYHTIMSLVSYSKSGSIKSKLTVFQYPTEFDNKYTIGWIGKFFLYKSRYIRFCDQNRIVPL
jgi:hypothetical protein